MQVNLLPFSWSGFWLMRRPKLIVEWYRLWKTMPVADWIKAAHLYQSSDFASAARYYSQGIARNPVHKAIQCARLDLAYCRYRLGDLEAADLELADLTRVGVPLKEAYLLRTKILTIFGLPFSALEVVSKCFKLYPQDVQVLVSFMHIALSARVSSIKLAEIKKRLENVKRELMIDDWRLVAVDTALAHYEMRCGDLETGERLLARALATGQAPYEAVLLRGERLLETHRIMPAREQLSRALSGTPRSPRPAQLLAESYLIPGAFYEPEWAKQLATLACQLSSWKNASCIDILIRVCQQSGDQSMVELLSHRIEALDSMQEMRRLQFPSTKNIELRVRSQKEPSA